MMSVYAYVFPVRPRFRPKMSENACLQTVFFLLLALNDVIERGLSLHSYVSRIALNMTTEIPPTFLKPAVC